MSGRQRHGRALVMIASALHPAGDFDVDGYPAQAVEAWDFEAEHERAFRPSRGLLRDARPLPVVSGDRVGLVVARRPGSRGWPSDLEVVVRQSFVDEIEEAHHQDGPLLWAAGRRRHASPTGRILIAVYVFAAEPGQAWRARCARERDLRRAGLRGALGIGRGAESVRAARLVAMVAPIGEGSRPPPRRSR